MKRENLVTIFSLIIILIFIVNTSSIEASPGFSDTGNSVTMNFAFHIGSSKDDDIITYYDNYVSSHDDNVVLALVFADSVFGTQINSSYSANDYIIRMRQPSDDNRFLIVFTTGSNQTIADKVDKISNGVLSKTFGSLTAKKPGTISTFMRLEYTDIDLISRVRWAKGENELVIKNEGLNNQGNSIVSMELVS